MGEVVDLPLLNRIPEPPGSFETTIAQWSQLRAQEARTHYETVCNALLKGGGLREGMHLSVATFALVHASVMDAWRNRLEVSASMLGQLRSYEEAFGLSPYGRKKNQETQKGPAGAPKKPSNPFGEFRR